MKITKRRLTAIIKEELNEIMDLTQASGPPGPEEQEMESLSRGWEKHINTEIWLNVEVVAPVAGERKQLDEFIAILGNYVVSGEVEIADANTLVKELAADVSTKIFEPNPHDWGVPLPKWKDMPGFTPEDEDHPYEDTDLVDRGELKEKRLTKKEKKEKERIVKGMKKDKKGFEKRYGDDAERVMYATATKQAKKRK